MSGILHWVRTRRGNFRAVGTLPLTDRGFRYGMAIFETIGVWQGKPVFLKEHLERAYRSAVESGFPIEMSWLDGAGEHLPSVLKSADTGVARLHITAGDGGPGDPVTNCRMVLSFERRLPVSPETRRCGFHLVTDPVEFLPTLNGRKTHNYWANLDALARARTAGADEAIVVSPCGLVLSTCMANLFLVSAEGTILTPSLGHGTRPGVIREWVLTRRSDIQEAPIQRSDLTTVQEAYITNSWLGIMPVAAIDTRALNERSVSNELAAKYQCHLRGLTL